MYHRLTVVVGARIELSTALRSTVQKVSGGAGRGSANNLPVEFGLGSADHIDQVLIRWPDGSTQVLLNVAVDQAFTVVQVPEPSILLLVAGLIAARARSWVGG